MIDSFGSWYLLGIGLRSFKYINNLHPSEINFSIQVYSHYVLNN